MRRLQTFLVLCLLLFFLQAQATTYYVNANATGANDGSSWSDAFTLLQDAIDATSSGDEIWVAAGTYYPTKASNGSATPTDPKTLVFYVNKGIQIYGGFLGMETDRDDADPTTNVTTLSADIGIPGDKTDNLYRVMFLYQTGSTFELDGFTITGGNTPTNGGGVYNVVNVEYATSSPTFKRCIFIDNHAGNAGGGYGSVSDLRGRNVTTFIRCKFLGNNANNQGGAIYSDTGPGGFDASFFLYNCLVSGNTSPSEAIYLAATGWYLPNVTNNCIATFVNSTIAFNSSRAFTSYQATPPNGNASCVFNNSIVWGNNAGSTQIQSGGSQSNCIVQNGWGSSLSQDPIFAQAGTGFDGAGPDNTYGTLDDDYSLLPQYPNTLNFSVAIDGGDNALLDPSYYIDLPGNARYHAASIDIGAYEYGAPTVENAILYVSGFAGGNNDGSSWANAFNDLQDAINAAQPGYKIFVSQGTYKPSIPVDLDGDGAEAREATFYIDKPHIELYGGFKGLEFGLADRAFRGTFPTILDGDIGVAGTDTDNAFHVMTLWDIGDDVLIDRFTIQNGKTEAYQNASFPVNTVGGGILIWARNGGEGSPTIRECDLLNNWAAYGGGICAHAAYSGETKALIERCYFGNNIGQWSAPALFFYGQNAGIIEPIIQNNIMNGNITTGTGSTATVYFHSDGAGSVQPYFVHNTVVNVFSGSTARIFGVQGALINNGKTAFVAANNILYGGAGGVAFSIGQISNAVTTPNIGTITGPLFVDIDGDDNIAGNADDNLNLVCDASAVGGTDANYVVPVDFNDKNRPAYDGDYDFGALEYGTVCEQRKSRIPASAGLYTSEYSVIEPLSGKRNFCDCNGELLLRLDIGTSGAVIPENGVQLQIGSPLVEYHAAGSSFMTNTQGGVILNRAWEVLPTTQPTNGTVGVDYFFLDSDYQAVNAELTTQGLTPLGQPNEMTFYKVITPGLTFPPLSTLTPSDVIVLNNGTTPSITEWSIRSEATTPNGVLHIASYLVNNFSGGGAGGGSAGESFESLGNPLKIMLKGPYNATTGLMDDALRRNRNIPNTEPFTGMGYEHTGLGGGEEVLQQVLDVSGADAIVDWVLLELRSPAEPSEIMQSQSALLQADGDIVSLNGHGLVYFPEADGEFYLTVKPRNHLAVMTGFNIVINQGIPIDFTDPSIDVYGINPLYNNGTINLFYDGDADGSGSINAADRAETWNLRNQAGYLMGDVNMDGTVNAADRATTWNNRNNSTQVP